MIFIVGYECGDESPTIVVRIYERDEYLQQYITNSWVWGIQVADIKLLAEEDY